MKPTNSRRMIVAATSAVMVGFAAMAAQSLQAESPDGELAPQFIQRVVAQTTRSGLAIRATRHLEAGTLSGKHQGWMRVETTLTPAGQFSWTILDEGGSDRTRDKVFRSVLETEADAWRHGGRDAAALTPANYEFTPLESGNGEVQIRLRPKRKDTRLVDGVLTVSADGYPLRLEGRLAKSPSFWVKSVHVVKRFGRFAGVALPTTVESHADLRMFGKSSFTMRYDYREVNGRRFAGATTAAKSGQ